MPAPAHNRVGVVLPVRGFIDGKTRLASRLDTARRRALVEDLATRAVDAAGSDGLELVVVTGAREVSAWARRIGVPVVDDPGSLNAAAAAGRSWGLGAGLERVVIAHADLPLVTSFAALVPADGTEVVLAPCRHDDGTNVISLPVAVEFDFAYGPGSFARHRAQALGRGLPTRVLRDHTLAFDIDSPEDLDDLEQVRA